MAGVRQFEHPLYKKELKRICIIFSCFRCLSSPYVAANSHAQGLISSFLLDKRDESCANVSEIPDTQTCAKS
jgi:hypothetical protein